MMSNAFTMASADMAKLIALGNASEAVLDEVVTEKTAEIKTYVDVETAETRAYVVEETLKKADKTYVDDLFDSVGDGSPKGVFATFAALQAAHPTGDGNIYLVTADGKWYYWMGSNWIAGGTYQSTGIADKDVTVNKLSDQFLNTLTPVYTLGGINLGYNVSSSTRIRTGFIKVNKQVKITVPSNVRVYLFYYSHVTLETSASSLIGDSKGWLTGTINIPQDCFLRFMARYNTESEFDSLESLASKISVEYIESYIPEKSIDSTDIADKSVTNTIIDFATFSMESVVHRNFTAGSIKINGWDVIIEGLTANIYYRTGSKGNATNTLYFVDFSRTIQSEQSLYWDTKTGNTKIINVGVDEIKSTDVLLLANYRGKWDGLLRQLAIENRITSTESNITALQNNLVTGNVLPSYYDAAIQNLIAKFHTATKVQGSKVFSFGVITDVHFSNLNQYRIYSLFKKLSEEIRLNHILNLGDFVFDVYTESELTAYAKSVYELRDKFLHVIGNHDVAGIRDNLDGLMYHYLLSNFNQDIVLDKGKENDCYYYVDDKLNEVRYIVLNSHASPYSFAILRDQVKWLVDVALTAPEGYGYIVANHEPLKDGMTDNLVWNRTAILEVLDSINTKTAASITTEDGDTLNVDYTGSTNYVIAHIAGHVHKDMNEKFNTVNCITTVNYSATNIPGAPVKVPGTSDEMALDIFNVNKEARTITILRLGVGSDRTISY